jgi:hypothetical protein
MRAPVTHPVAWPEAGFRAQTGTAELLLAEALAQAGSRPARVTAVLSAVYDTLDGQPAAGLADRLASGTRAWLLARAAAARGAGGWYQAECAACALPFDFPLALADLPRGEPGPGFPVAAAATSRGLRRFEVPNGGHEAALRKGDGKARLAGLLSLDDPEDWAPADLDAIEAAVDAASPDIADEVSCICPACGSDTRARVDPLEAFSASTETLFSEVHLLARAYGWRERVILELPSDRRRTYARMIRTDRSAGRGAER